MIDEQVAGYYTRSFKKYGCIPQGVDWNGVDAHHTRFAALSKHLPINDNFSVLDFGCGYGALYDFLTAANYDFSYVGYDIAAEILEAAKERFADKSNAQFYLSLPEDLIVNHAILNGVFHVKLDSDNTAWEEHVFSTLKQLLNYVHDSVAINFLSMKSDPDKRRDRLFYAEPNEFSEKLKNHFGWKVHLNEHPNLYEFVVLLNR